MRFRCFVGLDVHHNLVAATAINPSGKQFRESSLGPSPKDLVRFLRRLPRPAKVVLEATSVWERYYEAAKSTGAEVVLSHPRTTRMIAEASLKTDKVDSATLANLLRLGSVHYLQLLLHSGSVLSNADSQAGLVVFLSGGLPNTVSAIWWSL